MPRGRPPRPIDMMDIDLITWRFVQHQTYKQIGDHLDITRQAVQQKIRRVVEKMANATL